MTESVADWLERRLSEVEGHARANTGDSMHTTYCGYDQIEFMRDCKCDGPAMVLRLVAATQRLLELHDPIFRYVPMTKDRRIYLQGAEAVAMARRTDEIWKGDLECNACCDERGGGEVPRLPWPCPTVIELARGWGWTGE